MINLHPYKDLSYWRQPVVNELTIQRHATGWDVPGYWRGGANRN